MAIERINLFLTVAYQGVTPEQIAQNLFEFLKTQGGQCHGLYDIEDYDYTEVEG